MVAAKLSSKFQISIPKQIREKLNLQAGQTFLIITKGNVIQLVPKRSIEDIKGLLKGANTENIRDRTDRV